MKPVILKLIASAIMFFFVLSQTSATVQSEENDKPFETRFWNYLIGNNYKNWAPAPGQDGNFYSGQMPHGALLKMYINRVAAGDIEDLNPGSVVVLENYRSDRSLKSISVMYRTEGFNPEANDWYWVEYKPDGTVVREEGAKEAPLEQSKSKLKIGKSNSCIACHQKAGGQDFAFLNDRFNQNIADGKQPSKSISIR